MSSTHLSLHYHVVFGTKHQRPLITTGWRSRLHAYMGGTANRLEVLPEAIGGVADHVHLLLGLQANHRLSDVVREIKRTSSLWIHETIGDAEFQWQDGYGAFTVSVSLLETVRQYIMKQEIHHQQKTFPQEYVELLERHAVKYDERFLW